MLEIFCKQKKTTEDFITITQASQAGRIKLNIVRRLFNRRKAHRNFPPCPIEHAEGDLERKEEGMRTI